MKIEYKGYIIETETDPWALKYCGKFKYYSDEKIRSADSVEEAKQLIDEKDLS
jgi:hypothetical protein